MSLPHSRTLGVKIAADHRLLNYLRGRATETTERIPAGSTTIEVEGGIIASSCMEDHEEVLTCWRFYRPRGKPN